MDVEQLYKGLSDREKLAVIKLALPGIDNFLVDILAVESLSEEGEKIRLDFAHILENYGSTKSLHLGDSLKSINSEELVHNVLAGSSLELSRLNDGDDLSSTKGYNENSEEVYWSENPAPIEEKEDSTRSPGRKGTDSTEESGIFLCSRSLSQSDATLYTDTLNLPMLDSVDAHSRETIISESGSADYEVPDWESDTNGNEEGYFTGDNAFVDFSIQKLNLEPNDLGECHCGVMYIREQPGWHKRWFTITDHCLRCYRHRSEPKMLFEFPLKGARIIPTDRKKSRMFPLTLSVPRIHESITFATTEEQSRQEWLYVLNHVISRLVADDSSPDGTNSQYPMALDACFMRYHDDEESTHSLSKADRNRLSVDFLHDVQEPERRRKLSGCLEVPKIGDPSRIWTGSSENIANVDKPLAPWSIGVDNEDEMSVMDANLSPEMDEDESFRELQELLPDIIQGRKISTTSGKKKDRIFKAHSSSNVDCLGSEERQRSPSQKSILSSSSSEGRSASVSDIQSAAAGTKVKRHSSLANALSSKAMRVKSRIAGSFFKKGRKDDIKTHRELASFQSTTFSGYLLRRKGAQWKSRWCVVKEHALFCYKDFGIGTAELEVSLRGVTISILDDKDADKPYMFVLNSDKEELLFAAENDAELEEWVMVMEEEIKLNEDLPSPAAESPTNFNFPSSPSEPRSTPAALDSATLDPKAKGSNKKNKAASPTGVKKTSILSSIGHKLAKSKPKSVQPSLALPNVDERFMSGSVEDGYVLVEHTVKTENSSGTTPAVDRRSVERRPPAPSLRMEGFLNQRVDEDTWLKCWVKLENHTLHIHDDKDIADSVVVKIKLSNCIVKDWSYTHRPHVMEIRRILGRPLYLQAQSESDYTHWKSAISGSVVTTPTFNRRPVVTQSSAEDERSSRAPVTPLLKTTGDSLDKDEVFHKVEENPTSPFLQPLRPNTPLNPSPRPSTAGDVSNSESDDGETASRVTQGAVEVLKLRSFSEGEQFEERKTRSKLHRSISNTIPFFPRLPGVRKRRSRTVPNVNVSPDLLVNVRYSCCLFLRNSTGLWTKRWCVLQRDKLHLFRRPDDVVPAVSLPLQSCEVRRAGRKTKKFSFEVNIPSETEDYCFAADNEKDMMTWIRLLRAVAEETVEDRLTNETKKLGNGEAVIHDVESGEPITMESTHSLHQEDDETKENGSESPKMDACELASPGDMRVGQESPTLSERSEGSFQQNDVTVARLTSLDGVLKLLQEQQLARQLGQQKYCRTKKVQKAWQRSAAAVLKDQRAQPERPVSDEAEPANKETVVTLSKRRALSMTQSSALEFTSPLNAQGSANDIIEQFQKMADEEKLKSLKKETLLKKRRNSLTLEKDVLKRKMTRGHEKKSTVMKLLGKEESASKEEKERAEQRLQQVNQELAAIEKDLANNKIQEVQALDSLNAMKTKSVRRLSLMTDSKAKSEQKRSAFKNSPSESTSSQGSTDEKSGKESPKAQQISLDAARKQSAAVSLAVLEKELRKISPVGGRKMTVGGEATHGRISLSSEGSQDDFATKESPTLGKKRVSVSSEGSGNDQLCYPKWKFNDSAELRRKRFSGSGSQYAFRSLSVEIPTDDDNQTEEQEMVDGPPPHRLSVSSEKGTVDTVTRRLSVNSEKGAELGARAGEHRASLMNALSQIKDFEEFAAVSWGEKCLR